MEYRPIYTIAESEKSMVELASMKEYGIPVVIKRLKEANPDIYKLLLYAENPHIPKIYGVEVQGTDVLVAEEYVDGYNLEEYLKQQTLQDEEKLRIALQLCDAVEYLHSMESPIIHRDIKPSNILINSKGILKLIDFDASRNYKENRQGGDTRLLGTVEYAPPEQFGYSQTDVRSDIYSMGVVFHEMLLMDDEKRKEEWTRVVETCTGFDPKSRFQSVAELKKEIEKLIDWKKERQKKRIARFSLFLLVAFLIAAFALTVRTVVLRNAARNAMTEKPMISDNIDYHFYKGLTENTEVVLQNDFRMTGKELAGGTVYNYTTDERTEIPLELLESGVGYVRIQDEFLLGLEPALYEVEIRLSEIDSELETVWSSVLQVHEEEELPKTQESTLLRNTGEFYFEYPETVTAILSSNASGRINALYYRRVNQAEEAEMERLQAWCYEILCDGKVILIKKEYLREIRQDVGKLNLVVACDDGSMQNMQIDILEGIPEGAPAIVIEEEEPIDITSMSHKELYPDMEKAPKDIEYSYYKSVRTDFIFPDGKYREFEVFDHATCYCYQTGLTIEIPEEMIQLENDYVIVSEQFMMSLDSLVYEFYFYYNRGIRRTVLEKTIKVYPEEVVAFSTASPLMKSEQTIYSENPVQITNIVRNGVRSRIIRVYCLNQNGKREDLQYWNYGEPLSDGRTITIAENRLIQDYGEGKVPLWIELDNGELCEMMVNVEEGKPQEQWETLYWEIAKEKKVIFYNKSEETKPALVYAHNLEYVELTNVQFSRYESEESWKVPEKMTGSGTGYVSVAGEYLYTLAPGIYTVTFETPVATLELNVWISQEAILYETGQTDSYFIDDLRLAQLGVHAVLRYELSCSIVGVSIVRDGKEIPVEPEGYSVACDGRFMLVKKEYLMQYAEEGSVTLKYLFSDGGQQQIEIDLKSQ